MKKLTPLKAIKERCKECLGYEEKTINCDGKETESLIGVWKNVAGRRYECPLWSYRNGKRPTPEDRERLNTLGIRLLSPVKAIREYCLRCCNGDRKYVNECPSENCPLWIYRKGKNPKRGVRGIKVLVKNDS
jgi:hypothetical protein